MHPDYADYVQKRKIHPLAHWYDVKQCIRTVTHCELDRIYVKRVDHNDWIGWLVEFNTDVAVADIGREIFGVCILGKRAVFIGVVYG